MRRLTEFPTDAIIIILQNVNPADILCLRFTCKLFTTLPMLALRKTTKDEEWKSQRYKYEQSILAFRRYELDYYRAGKTLDLLICNKCGQLERAHSVVGFPDSASSLLPQVIKTRECIACRVNRFRNLRVAAICETMIGGEMMFICWLCKEGQPYSEDAVKRFLALSPNKIAKYLVAGAAIVKHKFCKTCWRNRKLIGHESEDIEKPETTDYTELIRMMEKMFPKLGKLGATKEEMDKITAEEELAAELEMLSIAGEQKRKFEREEAKRFEEELRLKEEAMPEQQEADSRASEEAVAEAQSSPVNGLDPSLSFSFLDDGENEHQANSSPANRPAVEYDNDLDIIDIQDPVAAIPLPLNTAEMMAPVAHLLSNHQAAMSSEPQDTTTISMENDAPDHSERRINMEEIIGKATITSAVVPTNQDVDEQHPFNTLEYVGVSDHDSNATDQSAHDSSSGSDVNDEVESEHEYRHPPTTNVTKPNINIAYKKLTIPTRPKVNLSTQSHQAKVESGSESDADHVAAEDDADQAISSEDNLVSSDFSTDYSDVEVDDYDLAIADQVRPTTVHNSDVTTSHNVNPVVKDVNMNGAGSTACVNNGADDGDADDEFDGDDMDLDVDAVIVQPKTLGSMDNMLWPAGRKM